MRIIDLIDGLQKLRATYNDEYLNIMGEPEIMIDVFKLVNPDTPGDYTRMYAGFHNKITIDKTPDGVYDVISSFAESYENEHTTAKLSPNG
jgi:hypothetical protein